MFEDMTVVICEECNTVSFDGKVVYEQECHYCSNKHSILKFEELTNAHIMLDAISLAMQEGSITGDMSEVSSLPYDLYEEFMTKDNDIETVKKIGRVIERYI